MTVEEYIEMIRLKTAVLLGCALDLGACIAGAGHEQMQHLRLFGEELGISFQLRDDYLDAFGDPAQFGKQVGGDILSDKKTYLLIRAWEKAHEADRMVLRNWLGKRTDESRKIAEVKAVMQHTGADTELLEVCERYYQSALRHLDALALPEARTAPLRTLAAQLLQRQS